MRICHKWKNEQLADNIVHLMGSDFIRVNTLFFIFISIPRVPKHHTVLLIDWHSLTCSCTFCPYKKPWSFIYPFKSLIVPNIILYFMARQASMKERSPIKKVKCKCDSKLFSLQTYTEGKIVFPYRDWYKLEIREILCIMTSAPSIVLYIVEVTTPWQRIIH